MTEAPKAAPEVSEIILGPVPNFSISGAVLCVPVNELVTREGRAALAPKLIQTLENALGAARCNSARPVGMIELRILVGAPEVPTAVAPPADN